MYDTTLGWRLNNPRMEVLGHTDPLGVTAERLAHGEHLSPEATNAEEVSHSYQISHEAQDRFALVSHQKAVAAQDAGRFAAEVIAVPLTTRKGMELVTADEGPRRDTSLEQLAKLKPAFQQDGSVTAGNSSGLNDGAAAVLLVSREYAQAHGLKPLAKIRSMAVAGVPPRYMRMPVPATTRALQRAGLTLADIDLIELNEAFAAQSLAVIQAWGLDPADARINPNGGAIALGHPLGCSGARILTTLVHEIQRRDVQCGLATMCIGVAQGITMIVERPDRDVPRLYLRDGGWGWRRDVSTRGWRFCRWISHSSISIPASGSSGTIERL
jgi:acetyl-CoA acetyltransferase family protein